MLVGTGVARANIKEEKERWLMEKISEVKVTPREKDFVGVFVPPPDNCPEMRLPVRVGQVLSVDNAKRTVMVGYFHPKDGTYDGRYAKWISAVAGMFTLSSAIN